MQKIKIKKLFFWIISREYAAAKEILDTDPEILIFHETQKISVFFFFFPSKSDRKKSENRRKFDNSIPHKMKTYFYHRPATAWWSIRAHFFSSSFSSSSPPPLKIFRTTLRYSANFRKTLRYSANLLLIATLKSMKINKINENQ